MDEERRMENKCLFEIPEKKGVFQQFRAEGFSNKVSGIVYENGELGSGIPLGGIGTGFIEITGEGKFGKTTIDNEFLKQPNLNTVFSFLKIKGKEFPLYLDKKLCKNIFYWGHFPFLDLIYKMDLPLQIELRAFSPFILGESENSNIPGIIFRFRFKNVSFKKISGNLLFCISKELNFNKHFMIKRVEKGICVNNYTLLTEEKKFKIVKNNNRVKIEVPFSLAEKTSQEIVFIFSWYFPWFKDSGGEPHQHHYAKKFSSSLEVARYLMTKRKILENKIIKWQDSIYQKDYPCWFKDALINGLYSLAKNTLWVDEKWKARWYPEKGFFTHSESFTGCPISETIVCRFHGHFPILFFFPDLEYTTLYGFKHFQIENGEIPFCFGQGNSLRDPRYHCQHPLNSSEYVQLVFRYYLRTKNEKFLKDFYPSVKKAINYAKSIDYDDDFLVNEDPHTLPGELWPANQFYDIWPWKGTSCYTAGIWLATLSAGIEMAKIMKDAKSEKMWKDWLQKGKRAFEKLLWNGKYYRLYNSGKEKSEICLANQLVGVWCTSILGLESPLPKENVQKALDSIINLNFKKTKWGLVNGMFPNGRKAKCRKDGDKNDHASQIFFAENICSAMVMIYSGKEKEGLEVLRRLIESYFVKYKTPWNQRCLLSSKNGYPVWGDDYYSNMIIWAVPLALERKNLEKFSFIYTPAKEIHKEE